MKIIALVTALSIKNKRFREVAKQTTGRCFECFV